MSSYRLVGTDKDHVGVIQTSRCPTAAWNLFWLSNPSIDDVPGLGHAWWKKYEVVECGLGAVIRDVEEDEVLFRKLLMHPMQFVEWFDREDQSIYDCYETYGESAWVVNVLHRAELAANRAIALNPPLSYAGNVVSINARRAA